MVPNYTPRATPIVPAPPRTSQPPSLTPPRGVPLRGTVTLVTPSDEVALSNQSVILGRSPNCDVCLTDSLVSRQHVRITVSDSAVTIEDLNSANGLYVNGTRIRFSEQLHDGDRILLGTTEISLFNRTGTSLLPRANLSAPTEIPRGAIVQGNLDKTERANAFDVLGRLAEKMLAAGRHLEAERVLYDHMTKVLGGARAGLPVPEGVAKTAIDFALRLANASGRNVWTDYIVELCVITGSVIGVKEIDSFLEAHKKAPADPQLLARYVEAVGARKRQLTGAERDAIERVEALLR